MLYFVLIGAILLGTGILVTGIVISRRSSDSLIEKRLGLQEEEARKKESESAKRTPVGDMLNQALEERGLGENLRIQLAQADIKFTVGEFLAATVILVIAATTLTFLISGDLIITAVVMLLSFFAPRIYIGMARNRRLKAFNDQLGDSINLLVNSLRAGYSILQAMDSVANEMDPPIATEFGRVVQEVQLGIPMGDALDHMLRRIDSPDLDMMVTAINVQREVGGNLAEVLDSISHTIRERIRIKGEIKALTSYGRGAGNLLSAVPVILAVLIYLINPEFMSLLFTHTCGYIMIGFAVVGIVAGYVVIQKIVNIDV